MAFLYNFAVNMLGQGWRRDANPAPVRHARSSIPTPPPKKRMRLWVDPPPRSPTKSQSSSSSEDELHERGYVKKKHKRVKTEAVEEDNEEEAELEDGDEDDELVSASDQNSNVEENGGSEDEEQEDTNEDDSEEGEGNILESVEEDEEEEEPQGYQIKPTNKFRAEVKLTEEEWAAERQRRTKAAQDVLDAGWSASERTLFNKLNMRGFEPLIPQDWRGQYEFSALPDNLFSASSEGAYLGNMVRPGISPSPHMPIYCLRLALDLGPRLRCISGQRPNYERTIRHTFDTYRKWGFKDSGLRNLKDRLAVVAIVQKRGNESGAMLQDKLLSELEKLEKQWRTQLAGRVVHDGDGPQPIPQLYGIIIASSIMGLLSYVPHDRRAQPSVEDDTQKPSATALHAHGLFNFLRAEYDVWNALAMSIIAVHVRDELYKAYTQTGLVEELGYVEESDPDL